MRRLLAAIMIAAIALFVVATSQGDASASDPVAEADFVGKINAYRASQGVGGVTPHPVLTAKAQAWAAHMAATGCLCHSNLSDGVSVRWSKLGENVGRGPNVQSLHDAFINSPAHRANMVDGRFRWVGIGVAYGAGQMWVAEVFMDGDGPAVPPRPSGMPVGSFDYAVRGPGVIGVNGWALDPDTKNPVVVHIYVDGWPAGATNASTSRPDVGRQFPGFGNNRGFSTNVAAGKGDHTVCAYAINQYNGSGNPTLGCRRVPNTPIGSLDTATPTPGGLKTSGWAIGQDTAGPVDVHFYFNNRPVRAATANGWRGDVGAAYPTYGPGHGFSLNLPNESGALCAYAINAAGNGNNPTLGCRWVNTNPFGSLDGVNRVGNGVRVKGWSLDPDADDRVPVHVYVDGRPAAALTTDGVRPDVSAAYRGYGSRHAFDAVVRVGPGAHTVCAYAINRGSGFGNPLLGCRVG
jgi:hypothetical protein